MAEVNETATQASVATPVHTRSAERSVTVHLDWPVEYAGKTWDAIVVRRMSAAQLKEFYESLASNAKDARLPMFDAPPEVLNALDADDDMKLEEVAQRFLPRRLVERRTDEGQIQEPGGLSSPSPAAT